jgi:hypothetical protein
VIAADRQTAGRYQGGRAERDNGMKWLYFLPLLALSAGGLYSPVTGNDGVYRVERYTFTSLWTDRTDTRLRQRSADARIEYLDLFAESGPSGK